MPELDLPRIPAGTRLTGPRLDAFRTQVVSAYAKDMATIREISEATGRSYGSIRWLLVTGNATLRRRGMRRRRSPRGRGPRDHASLAHRAAPGQDTNAQPTAAVAEPVVEEPPAPRRTEGDTSC